MNLDGLKRETEKRLARIETRLAFYALKDDSRGLDRLRYRRLSSVDVGKYLQPGERIDLHRSMMPPDETGWHEAPRIFHWEEWTTLAVEHLGDCVRVLVHGYGNLPIPRGDFVRAVLTGHVRAPLNAAAEPTVAGSTCSGS